MSKSLKKKTRIFKGKKTSLTNLRKTLTKSKTGTDFEFKTFLPFRDERDALGRLLPRIEMVKQGFNTENISKKSYASNSPYLDFMAESDTKWRMVKNKVKKPRYEDYCKFDFSKKK
jgi:hypothetical protein